MRFDHRQNIEEVLKIKRITTYAEFQALKAIYKSAKVVSVSDHGTLIFLRK